MATTNDIRIRLALLGGGSVSAGIRQVESALTGLRRLALPIAGTVAAALGVRELAQSARATVDLGGKLSDLSARTGIAARQLLVLGQAFKDNGLSSDAVGTVLPKLNKALYDASTIGGETARAFRDLGLSTAELLELEPDKRFEAVAAALGRIEDPARRDALAMQLFGRAGAELNTLFRNGGAIEDARRSFGRMPEILERNVELLDRIGDVTGRLPNKGLQLWVGIFDQVGPAIRDAFNKLDSLDLTQLGQNIGAYVNVAIKSWNDGEFDQFIGLTIQAGFELGRKGVDDLIKYIAESINAGALGRSLKAGAWVMAGQVAQQSIEGMKNAMRVLALPVSLNDKATDQAIVEFFNNWKGGVADVAAKYAGLRTQSNSAMPAAQALFEKMEAHKALRDAEAGVGVATQLAGMTVTAKRIGQWTTEADLLRAILILQESRATVEGDYRLTDVEKYRYRIQFLQQEKSLMEARIGLLTRESEAKPDDQQLKSRIDGASRDLSGVNTQIAGAGPNPESFEAQFQSTLATLQNQWGTWATQMAGTFSTTFNSAISSISNGISGLILGTQTWGQALMNIGTSIVTTIVQAFVQMGVRYIATRILMWTMGKALDSAGLAANAAFAKSYAAVWATAATLATIGSYGTAALAAPGLITAAQGIVAGSALLGFEGGGYTGDGPSGAVAGLVHRGEFVFPQDAVNRLGVDTLAGLAFNRSPGSLDFSAMAGQSSFSPVINAQAGPTRVVVVNEDQYEAMLRAGELDDAIVERINRNRSRVGIRS